MRYQSTRGGVAPVSSAETIQKGIAPDGGLFVPTERVELPPEEVAALAGKPYPDRALAILKCYLTDYSGEELAGCVNAAYTQDKFSSPDIAPLHRLNDTAQVLELWHGPTCAFKDMALQILPHLVVRAMRKSGDDAELVILVATSGDTGKAALEGFKDVPGTRVVVFFPDQGVSAVQKLQMVTQEGRNVHSIGVSGGNFDDAQNGVKAIFADKRFNQVLQKKGFKLSSANSINWGRLVPQVAYYWSAYAQLVRDQGLPPGTRVNIAVPTGNFGNILAAYYAREMGLPVSRLICASNANNVLTDFIASGRYDKNRPLQKTMSPSMDIIISSNLERLLFELTGHDPKPVHEWMSSLARTGQYSIGKEMRAKIAELFWGDYCTEEETLETIRKVYQEYRYLVDTHTAVAVNVYGKYLQATGDRTRTIIASTASPFKFNQSVASALFGVQQIAGKSEFELLEMVSRECQLPIPEGLKDLQKKPIRHRRICRTSEMTGQVAEILFDRARNPS